MTLNLPKVGRLITEMGRELASEVDRADQRLEAALMTLRTWGRDADGLNERVERAGNRFAGLTAGLVEPIDHRGALPPPVSEYTVGATDGSLIEPDRHAAAYYFLMNIGSVLLRYGQKSGATLSSSPELGYRPEEMYLSVGEREIPMEGGILRVKRAVAETQALATLLLESGCRPPLVGLQDGTLIPWMPEGHGVDEEKLREALLPPVVVALDRLRKARVAVASYISRPRSTEVINALRLASCPFPSVDCRSNCPKRGPRHPAPCDEHFFGLTDRRLLAVTPLAEGERSALFFSRSPVVKRFHAERVYFCYVNVGPEIARLEMPEWIACDSLALNFVHATVFDQCVRGAGYPRALTEAHEQAVITFSERQQCERLAEAALALNSLSGKTSQKAQSKRLRGL